MPQFDCLSSSVITAYDTGLYTNVFYFQRLDNNPGDTELLDVSNIVELQIVRDLKKITTDAVQYERTITRTLKPARTDVSVFALNGSGDIPQSTLPATSFTLLRYYCRPYTAGTSYHWKINGIPHDANNRGKLTAEQAVRYSDLIQTLTQGVITQNNHEYQLINSKDASQGGVAQLPRVYKANVDTTIRNLRSRQPAIS